MPDSRLVPGTVRVYLDGNDITATVPEYDEDADPPQSQYVALEPGRLQIDAPDTGQTLQVSYYFQWFTDAELVEFLQLAAQLLGYEDVEDGSLTLKFRTPLTSFAAHYAYLKMAANAAQALAAGAAGYTADNTAEHPNWMNLAKLAWETAMKELETATINPVSAVRPHMKFVSFRLPRYVPRS